MPMTKQRSGFATLNKHDLWAICHKAGVISHLRGVAHEWTSEEAREAGRRGGRVTAARWKAQHGQERSND